MKATKAQTATIDRLKRRSDFLRVQGAGRKWVAPTLILQIAENGQERARYGLTVSKRTDKSAVVRNRIRRRLRAAALDVLTCGAKTGHDYVLIGRAAGALRPYADIEKDLRWCLKRMEALDPC